MMNYHRHYRPRHRAAAVLFYVAVDIVVYRCLCELARDVSRGRLRSRPSMSDRYCSERCVEVTPGGSSPLDHSSAMRATTATTRWCAATPACQSPIGGDRSAKRKFEATTARLLVGYVFSVVQVWASSGISRFVWRYEIHGCVGSFASLNSYKSGLDSVNDCD